jgi:hypothetical protein
MRHARSLVRQVCRIAGQPTWVDEVQSDAIAGGLVDAVADHNTAVIFDWLIHAVSHQGISDAIADRYIDRHGNVTWAEIEISLATNPSCAKLEGYWAFTGCRYYKGFQTCANPAQFPDCPLPRHRLRNGRLNQTAYSYSCSSGTLLVATSSTGSISNSPTIPATYRRPGPPSSTRFGMFTGFPTRSSASAIDARRFNPAFPKTFPRFIASAIWRYCAEPGLDICNGNQIDDRGRCTNMWCRLYGRCDRLVLHAEPKMAEK